VVFRWVGVAAPAQRCFQEIVQWVTGRYLERGVSAFGVWRSGVRSPAAEADALDVVG
jgi:hypothetical protein